ncbi:peptidase [Sphingomonas lacunae]|uniref:Peptidase n=1 Tax=Sphingomonas lacunae TaxID=2698828 RepID=A0A6M4AZ35_9SPHN|nr:prepilin peptidase [Sphingomonas lacunae]QJQ33329.1 peptidase [Sphingomonas lacunae]
MNGELTIFVAPALLVGMLLTACYTDLKSRTIPNLLNVAIALVAPLVWWTMGWELWPDIAWQVGVALALLVAFFGLFALGQMGGGDVKMIAALALSIDVRLILPMMLVFSIAGGVVAGAMLIHQKMQKMEKPPEVPYGLAIAFGGFWAIYQQYINHLPVIPAA